MSFPSRKSGPNYEFGRVNSGTGKVPNAQKPKARPPRGVRDRIGGIASSLPTYSGPYGVGVLDIEVPVRKPRHFSQITRKKQHILRLETVLMTIYYPSAFDVGRGQDPGGHKQWSRQTWLPRPRIKSAKGYGIFAGVGSLGVPWFALTTMLTKLPAYRNAPLATHWPPIRTSQSGGRNPNCEAGPTPTGESDMPVFPMLIFSHGLGGTRTAYSSVCGEFASYGFVVCALEHRDGSGPRTYVNHAPVGVGSMEEREKAGNIQHNAGQKERGYDTVDYIFPQENHKDTDPNNEKGHDRELRSAQIEMRMAEVEEAYHIMRMIADGDGTAVAEMNLRRKGFVGSSSRGLDGVDWSLWKGRFNYHHTTMAGHSFGAATTVEILRNNKRFSYISQGIIFDIWGATVSPLTDDSDYRIKVPIIALNSEAFMYWPENFSAVSALIDEAKSQGLPAWLLTVRGTVHLSHSDFPILYPITCAVTQRMTANPKRALDININACLEFLQLTLPTSSSIIERAMEHEGVLDVDVLDEVPTLHKPPQKYIAARLEVPHQFRSRVIPKATRKFKRAMNTPDLSDEVWSHARPDKDELQRYIEKKDTESD